MGLFEMLFPKKKNEKIHSREFFQMLNGYSPIYSNFNGCLYEMMQIKSAINTIASDCGKAIPQLAKHNRQLDYILKHRPNPFMSTSEFIERSVTNLLCDNNSFIIPILDEFDRTIGIFPITYSSATLIDYNGEPYVEYTFSNGKKGIAELGRTGFMKRMQYKNDFFGDNNNALNQTTEIIHSQNESIIDALKHSGYIRFMGQINEQLISKEDFEEERKLFSEINLTNNNSQMMLFDSRYKEIKQVESKPIYLDEKQKQMIDDNIYDYFGVSKKYIQHSFQNDYEWNSVYEGVIEPILIKLAAALTNMLYTPSQIMSGNQVYLTANRLQYMSNESKLAFCSQMFDRGVINGNDVCDVWQLPHYEGGEKHYIRKEYAEINKLDVIEQVEMGGNEDDIEANE